ncbi:MAG: oligopeptidase [Gammaproteobacteria bacterium]|jgi:oligopeptidase A|nr:oligopeptidase [Gammaproteobacteria bacterium]
MLNFQLENISQLPEKLKKLTDEQRQTLEHFLAENAQPNYHELISLLEAQDDALHKFWTPIAHLNAVMNEESLRKAYEACLPILSSHHTYIAHHQKLFAAFEHIAHRNEFHQLSCAEQKYILDGIRDFKLAGVDLPPEKKKTFAELSIKLSELANTFQLHLLDATDAWSLTFESTEALRGIPENLQAMFKQFAAEANKTGYLINLQAPSYQAVLTYAEDRELRKKVYEAYQTRASEIGPNAGKFDNTPVMYEILSLRHQLAQLVGFPDYASYSLTTKMAKSPEKVNDFLQTLVKLAKPFAEKEFATLVEFAKTLGIKTVEPWDVTFLSEKLKQKNLQFDDETLRPYFPLSIVLQGLFSIAEKLYSIRFKPAALPQWHPDVKSFEVQDLHGNTIAHFYCDLYARSKKQGGAWMDDAQSFWKARDQKPIAFLVCNFTPPVQGEALLTHDEVVTLFHEFGHGLHHMLTQVEVRGLSGTHVEWDAVELPSQIMENWCWQAEALNLLSQHFQTQEKLPAVLLEQLLKSKNFLSGLFLVRQLEFALFDLGLHWKFDPNQGPEQIQQTLDYVRQEVTVVPVSPFNRFQHSFAHIFAGGYASGYYSYLWAEVLSADAFSLFEEKGIFSNEIGRQFRTHVLEKGGAENADVLFKNFRGREPDLQALLKSYGLM